jgi:hypothetical protein
MAQGRISVLLAQVLASVLDEQKGVIQVRHYLRFLYHVCVATQKYESLSHVLASAPTCILFMFSPFLFFLPPKDGSQRESAIGGTF